MSETVHLFVDRLLDRDESPELRTIASGLELEGYAMRVSRDLDSCRGHLRDRYEGDPGARFGMLASSRDRDLVQFGVRNDWASTKRLRYGPWFVEGDDDPLGRSCRSLRDCVTEFGCQGLELDGAGSHGGLISFAMPEAGTTRALGSTKTPIASGMRTNCAGTGIGSS